MTVELKISLSESAANLLPQLQETLGCESRSELMELLILSQIHPAGAARELLKSRAKRGRPWPVK